MLTNGQRHIETATASIDYNTWSRDELICRIQELETSLISPHNHDITSLHPLSAATNPKPSTASKRTRRATPKRQFDFSKTSCRPIALKLAYLGHEYRGFAGSDNDIYDTIETHLFHALATTKLIPERSKCNYSRCGRTDKGVSAFDQVIGLFVRSHLKDGLNDEDGVIGGTYRWEQVGDVSARDSAVGRCGDDDGGEDTNRKHAINHINSSTKSSSHHHSINPSTSPTAHSQVQEIDYPTILNKLLPPTIRILAWSPVPPTFSARFDCSSRSYRYYFLASTLNIPLMKTAASAFKGVHDYTNFCRVDPSRDVNHIRVIEDAGIFRVDEIDEYLCNPVSTQHNCGTSSRTDSPNTMMVFYVKGRAFLWHQVRCMMAILFLIGEELEPPSLVSTLLNDVDASRGRPCYDLASEYPLVLAECAFPDRLINWVHPISSNSQQQEAVIPSIYTLYADSLLKSSMIEYLLQCATLSSSRRHLEEDVIRALGGSGTSGPLIGKKGFTPVFMRPRAESQHSRRSKVIRKAAAVSSIPNAE
ncbi:hypothetical protein SeMB42_g01784 [Synchytrium endobioticum]|uniref:Pseudouridine synthase I TruA alpha/beta domain-containing protein n=1 Tax=Synchytrium endobioticum TaxID=286115 RepID=A0A507D7W5_9FUNG|nr:hypothetical protein SeLEV6574_g02516 [Synchytrium endobioticum]TPX51901.1 hypothetical protein SeMB42_g01784 [Synchytrium endobioticum]